jgi:predicted alpha-1,6-mannanase (GH76 family)
MTGGTPPDGNVLVYSGFSYCIGTVADGNCELDAIDDDTLKAVYLGDINHKGSISSSLP